MARRHRTPFAAPPAGGGVPPWAFPFGGLMMLLFAFFVLLYSGAGNGGGGSGAGQAQTAPKRAASLSAVKRRLESEVESAGGDRFVKIVSADQELLIRFDASLLFVSGRADLKPEGLPAMDAIGRVLVGVGNRLRIEGHTDSDPMIPNPQYPDNWMLSGARATGVLRYLHEFHALPFSRISIAGYADTRPVAANDTPAGKAKNRRVDIVVLGY